MVLVIGPPTFFAGCHKICSFQSRKRLYIHKCPSVRSFVCPSVTKPLNSLKSSSFILHHSSFIIHHSSFFIHPSFISQLLSFSACFTTITISIIHYSICLLNPVIFLWNEIIPQTCHYNQHLSCLIVELITMTRMTYVTDVFPFHHINYINNCHSKLT